ncbi:hypothetical protein ES703_120134 [subsurface metagenome]
MIFSFDLEHAAHIAEIFQYGIALVFFPRPQRVLSGSQADAPFSMLPRAAMSGIPHIVLFPAVFKNHCAGHVPVIPASLRAEVENGFVAVFLEGS